LFVFATKAVNYTSYCHFACCTFLLLAANNSYHFNELQIYGGAQLAVLTDPPGSPASINFDNMIGDRTGAIHVGPNQTLDLLRPAIDLPFSVHVYQEVSWHLYTFTHI
jgi:hypothetical protein